MKNICYHLLWSLHQPCDMGRKGAVTHILWLRALEFGGIKWLSQSHKTDEWWIWTRDVVVGCFGTEIFEYLIPLDHGLKHWFKSSPHSLGTFSYNKAAARRWLVFLELVTKPRERAMPKPKEGSMPDPVPASAFKSWLQNYAVLLILGPLSDPVYSISFSPSLVSSYTHQSLPGAKMTTLTGQSSKTIQTSHLYIRLANNYLHPNWQNLDELLLLITWKRGCCAAAWVA